jgi:hypothetical protein
LLAPKFGILIIRFISISQKFGLLHAARQLRAKVKQWTLKKMAELFRGVEEEIMEKLSEDKESASIQRVSSEAGESLEGISGVVTSHDVRLEIERTPKCALHSCIENLGNFRAFK